MTADPTPADGAMQQAHAYVEIAMQQDPPQPRRYIARRLYDSFSCTTREIADLLGVDHSTISRDLKETKEPIAQTPKGTAVYKAGRFDSDPEYQARVDGLAHEIGRSNARIQAAREFAGPPRVEVRRLRSTDKQRELQAAALKAFA